MTSQKSTRQVSGPLLFIDAEQTLWEKNIWYAEATQELPELRHLSPAQVAAALDQQDVLGSAEMAFPQAIIHTFHDLFGPPSSTDLVHLRQVGQVSRRTLPVLPDVAHTLHTLSRRYRLVLVSKGEPSEQEHKRERSGLRSFFAQSPRNRVRITRRITQTG